MVIMAAEKTEWRKDVKGHRQGKRNKTSRLAGNRVGLLSWFGQWSVCFALGNIEKSGTMVTEIGKIILGRTVYPNHSLAFCIQAEFKRKIMTSASFFRLVKFERLAGWLSVCLPDIWKWEAKFRWGLELSHLFTLPCAEGVHSWLTVSFTVQTPVLIFNARPICWLYKRFNYMQKNKSKGHLKIHWWSPDCLKRKNLQKWFYNPSILKI